MKKKPTQPKNRLPYVWHLSPPLDGKIKFDNTHWWKGKPEVDPVAALYELARRHPLAGEAIEKRVQVQPGFNDLPSPIKCLAQVGLKPWTGLGEGTKGYWKSLAGNLKGVDCRSQREKCDNIIAQALDDIVREFCFATGKTVPPSDASRALIVTERGEAAREAAIAQRAIAAYRQGYALLAVAPDLEREEAETLLGQSYRAHRTAIVAGKGEGKHRARAKQWLIAISEFENDEASGQRAKSPVFNAYKKIIDSIDFASPL